MSVLHAILLGIAQGLTEFLPVSSSGHLQIIPWLADWNDFEGNDDLKKAFDVALHLGTLVGLVACLRREVWALVRDGVAAVAQRRAAMTAEGRLGWLLVLATVPAAAVGVGLRSVIDEADDEVWLTAVMLAVFGVLLWWADRRQGQRSTGERRGARRRAVGFGPGLLSPAGGVALGGDHHRRTAAQLRSRGRRPPGHADERAGDRGGRRLSVHRHRRVGRHPLRCPGRFRMGHGGIGGHRIRRGQGAAGAGAHPQLRPVRGVSGAGGPAGAQPDRFASVR